MSLERVNDGIESELQQAAYQERSTYHQHPNFQKQEGYQWRNHQGSYKRCEVSNHERPASSGSGPALKASICQLERFTFVLRKKTRSRGCGVFDERAGRTSRSATIVSQADVIRPMRVSSFVSLYLKLGMERMQRLRIG